MTANTAKPEAKLIDDCFVLDKDRLPHHEAIAILKARIRAVNAGSRRICSWV